MAENVPPQTIYEFIVNDFESAWDSLAANQSARGRGNFMFARQAVTLLEWAARLCSVDTTGAALRAFSDAMLRIEARYFTELPNICADFEEFELPSRSGPRPQAQLLWAIFDLVRHGHAHQYQQIMVDLTDGKQFVIQHSGAQPGLYLRIVTQDRDRSGHLGYSRDSLGNVYLLVRPDMLFVDVKAAIQDAALLARGLSFPYLTRPWAKALRRPKIPGPYYQFDSDDLEVWVPGNLAGDFRKFWPLPRMLTPRVV